MRRIAGLLVLLLTCSAGAEVVAGRSSILFLDRWVPLAGGPTTYIGHPARAGAFDGERFLVGWRDGGVVWLALYDEGATIPWTVTSIDVEGTAPPIIRWNGSVFVVVCPGPVTTLAVTSRQGVVESLHELPEATSIVDAAASPSGVALLSLYSTNTPTPSTPKLDVLLVDDFRRVSSRTALGWVAQSTVGMGGTYITIPHIAPFGNIFYAAWREGRSARWDRIVGTRVMLDGTAPDLVPSEREPNSQSATLISNEIPPLASFIGIKQYGLRLAVQPVRLTGFGITTAFVEPDGSVRKTDYRFSTALTPMPNGFATVRLADGSIAVVYVKPDGTGVVTPLLPPPPPSRRRAA